MLRKVLQTLTLGSLFLAVTLYYGWNKLKVNDYLRSFVIAKLKATIGEQCKIQDVRFGFGNVHMQGVQLAFKEAPYDLWIQDLQLGYSLKSLLKGRFDPERASEEITFYKPRLTLAYNPNKKAISDVDLSLQLDDGTAVDAQYLYSALLKQYDFIERITISEGEILLVDTTSARETRVAQEINGWAYTDDENHAWFRLAGHIFDTEDYNMVLYGQLDLNRGGFDFLNVDLHDYHVNERIPFIIPDYFDVLDGVVNGHIVIKERLQGPRGFNVAGSLNLRDGRLKIDSENLYFDNISVDTKVNDWNLIITDAKLDVNNSPMRLEGKIKDLLHPEFDLRLTSNKIDISTFLTQFLPEKKIPIQGNAAIEVAITHSLLKPLIQGRATADSIRVLGKKLTDLQVDLGYENASLTLPKITGLFHDARISGSGSMDFSTPDRIVGLKLQAHGDFSNELQAFGLTSAQECRGDIAMDFYGPIKQPTSTGSYEVQLRKGVDDYLNLNGNISYTQGRFALTSASTNSDFKMTTIVNDVFDKHRSAEIEATNFENTFAFSDDPKIEYLKKHYKLNLKVKSSGDRARVQIDGFRRDNYENLFQIDAATEWVKHSKAVHGNITLFPNSADPMAGSFDLEISKDLVRLNNFEIGHWLSGSAQLTRDNYLPQEGKLTISGAPFSALLDLLAAPSQTYQGKLYGQLLLHRTAGKPAYDGKLWLLDAFWHGVGPLKAEMSMRLSDGTLEVKSLSIDKFDAPFLKGEGRYDFATKEMEASIGGSDIKVDEVVKILTGKDKIVGGNAFVQLTLKGKAPNVPVYGNIEVHHANILMLNFDEVLLDFGSEIHKNGSFISGEKLYVGNVKLTREDAFALNGTAALPFQGGASMDVQLSGSGNFLTALTDLEDFFESSRSSGQLDLHLTGAYTKPRFAGSRFTFTDGYLKLASVVNKIKNLQGDLAVENDDYFLNIKTLKGTIDKRSFSISNIRDLATLNQREYEPLRIAGDDMNLGALVLQTDPRGVPLNIPGLMEPREIGWYSFVGRTHQDRFYIAGPWDRPKVSGKIQIRNANLTYPFDEGSGKGDPLVANILDNIDWDVKLVSAKDTRYVKQFPTAVYVNVELDEQNSGLDFTGVLKDSTFRIAGKVESKRGTFEYLNLNFRVDKFGVEFNNASLFPVVYGKAWTVVRDTSNNPSDVYLTLYTVDNFTNQEVRKGRWDRIQIKLSSEYPKFDETQTQLMATLGYSTENMDSQAINVVGYSTDNLLFRPLMRPIERELERKLGLDVVRFSYAITRNFLDSNFNNEELRSSLSFLRSSKLVLGKYLTSDLYLLYSGQLDAGIDYQFKDKGVGLRHFVGLEYRLKPSLLFQVEYDYNTLLETHKDDKKFWLRHSFFF